MEAGEVVRPSLPNFVYATCRMKRVEDEGIRNVPVVFRAFEWHGFLRHLGGKAAAIALLLAGELNYAFLFLYEKIANSAIVSLIDS